jgi:hypothetical protein
VRPRLRAVSRRAALAVATLVLCAVSVRPASGQQAGKPRIEPARVIGEAFAGAYAGIGGFILGRFVTEGVTDLMGIDNETARRRVGFVGGVVGGGLATAGVVYAIGNIGGQTGDFDATYLGTGVGFVAALGVARMALGPGGRPREGSSTARRWATANVVALLPAIGATIGFNSTRRNK